MSELLTNKYLHALENDYFYHLGFSVKSKNIEEDFSDVKFICVGGSEHRMIQFAKLLAAEAGMDISPRNLAENGRRFVLFKVGSVLIANHGMGMPSMSILLHEIFKLVQHAGCKNVTLIRIGSSGGLGVPPGTVVITGEPLNAKLIPEYEITILGKQAKRRAHMDADLVEEFRQVALRILPKEQVVVGKTVGTNDFYEEQARMDGAVCTFTSEERNAYLRQAFEIGVRNFEMECVCLAAMANMVEIRVGIICVTFLDRLKSDQVLISNADHLKYESYPCSVVCNYLKEKNALNVS